MALWYSFSPVKNLEKNCFETFFKLNIWIADRAKKEKSHYWRIEFGITKMHPAIDI